MHKIIAGTIGFIAAGASFVAALPAHAASADAVLDADNAASLAQTFQVLHTTLDDLQSQINAGTLDANIIHPREVFKPALEYSAAAVILVHNHPSGDVTPSSADLEITGQLVKAGKLLGIDLIDHVIVTKDSFMSIPAAYQ